LVHVVLGRLSGCWLLVYTPTIAVYYHCHSAGKPILISPFDGVGRGVKGRVSGRRDGAHIAVTVVINRERTAPVFDRCSSQILFGARPLDQYDVAVTICRILPTGVNTLQTLGVLPFPSFPSPPSDTSPFSTLPIHCPLMSSPL